MKKLFLPFPLLLLYFTLVAQDFVMPNRPNTILSSWPGYITYIMNLTQELGQS